MKNLGLQFKVIRAQNILSGPVTDCKVTVTELLAKYKWRNATHNFMFMASENMNAKNMMQLNQQGFSRSSI